MFARVRSRLRALFRRSCLEREMESEIAAHIERHTQELMAAGMPPGEAARRARIEFGSLEAASEECREAVGLRWPDEIRRDLRYAIRVLGRSPGFTLAALVTLSLCIGANTAIYSVVDAVLFRPLPYAEPERLMQVVRSFQSGGVEADEVSQDGRAWETVRDHASLIDAAAYSELVSGVNFAARGSVDYVRQQRVSEGFFRVLGVPPMIGREFNRQEDSSGGPPVAVLSYDLWKHAFGGDPRVVGQAARLRGEMFTVVGVMPPGFRTSAFADVWTPLRPSPMGEGAGTNYSVIARLRSGVARAQADSQMQAIGQTALNKFSLPPGATVRLALIPLQEGLTQGWRGTLLVLWAAVAMVLLIGCVNIASLLLARAAGRTREIATRMALGCGRAGVMRQLLAESLVLGVAGAAGGLLVGYLGIRALETVLQQRMEIWQGIAIDLRVLAATACIALLTSLLFGIYPAIHASRLDIRPALAEAGGRGIAGGRSRWPRRVLVTAEVALCFVLLIGAGLLIRTFAHLTHLRPGFDPNGVIAASLSLQDARYNTAERVNRLADETLSRIRSVRGVEAAGMGLSVPYQRPLNIGFRLPGARSDGREITNLTYVTPGYFEALRIPLVAGRLLNVSDTKDSAPVVVVNERFVRVYLKDRAPLGSHVTLGRATVAIVGVVGDVQQRPGWGDFGPVAAMPGMFMPLSQTDDGMLNMAHTWFSPSWVVRAGRVRGEMVAEMQRAVAAVDPQLPFASFRTMDEVKLETLAMQRFQAMLLGVLAGLALMLAAIGIYGLISNSVAERTRELGIRMALGATVREGIQAVAVPGVALAAAGVAIGWILARAAAQALRHVIWGVRPGDPLTFAAVAAGLLVVAALASILPALRVSRLDPARTLRTE